MSTDYLKQFTDLHTTNRTYWRAAACHCAQQAMASAHKAVGLLAKGRLLAPCPDPRKERL